ncbi:MAG TPA: DUF3413 domain-containing protein, partial [Psychromonas hadalis]|nr:DUF3413 domain-containing protein [Psychromonas hadalis]
MQKITIKETLSKYSWFILFNSFIGILISIRYFLYLPEWPSNIFAALFIITSIISQLALLSGIVALVASPVLLIKSDKLRLPLLAFISSLLIVLLIIDTFVFSQYRFHINKVVVDILLADGLSAFSLVSWLIVIASAFTLFIFQLFVLKKINNTNTKFLSLKKVLFVIFLCFSYTQVAHIWANANAYRPITTVKRYLPLFIPFTATTFMTKHGWVDEKALAEQRALKVSHKSDLNYPLEALTTEAPKKLKNILFLVVDSWRYDTFNKDNTPHIWALVQSEKGLSFKHHLSSGNATRTGIFGLFYGVHGTYWHAFLANQQSPLLVDRLQALNYSIGIFASARLTKPEFNQTVFRNIPNLREKTVGDSPATRDIQLTQDWLDWYDSQKKDTPKFSFLFYDAPHGYDFPAGYKHQYLPMVDSVNYLALNNETVPKKLFNRYKTSVHFVDSLINSVIEKLKKSGDFDNTIIIVTGDHGQELNDNKLNFWGHNSNFTAAQTHVPFILIDPSLPKNNINTNQEEMTSHVDVVPTLMKNYLGVSSSINNYSVGVDLLGDVAPREWLLSSSFSR